MTTETPGRAPVGTSLPAPRLARAITILALASFCTATLLNVVDSEPGTDLLVTCLVLVVITFGVQVAIVTTPLRTQPLRYRVLALVVLALLTYLPFVAFGLVWGSMAGPLAGSCLLLMGRAAPAMFVTVLVSVPVISTLHEHAVADTIYFTMSTLITSLVIWGLARMTGLISEVHAMRAELARVAVAQERLRFSRDLHDLLGYSLSAITLKSEVAYRLIPDRTEEARKEIASVLEVSRQALSDARMVSSSYREMRLETEVELAQSVLEAAGVRTTIAADCPRLHPVVDTALATVLREGVTNMLRHSKVQECAITAEADGGRATLTLVNDGLGERSARASPHGGAGISNLRTRMTAIGGRLDAGMRDDSRFQLRAEAPMKPDSVLLPDQHTPPENAH